MAAARFRDGGRAVPGVGRPAILVGLPDKFVDVVEPEVENQ